MGNRDELWKAVWETLYDAQYYEILFGEISKKWQTFDFTARLLVALTASSSAIAGWALWNNEDYKVGWAVFAGIASLFSIIHATLNTQEKLKRYAKLATDISNVKLDYETLWHELSVYSEFDINKTFKKHQKLRESFQKVLLSHSADFMSSKRIQNKAQTILNTKLGIKE